MKRSFFQAAVVSILLHGCTTWTLTKRLEKTLDGNHKRMLGAILNKSWRQHPSKHQVYRHLPPITKTIQVRQARHAGHCWRSRDELISDVLLWTSTYGQAKAGRPARTYIQQPCEDTGCSAEDLPEAINDREKWRERVRDIRASSTTWWWWWLFDKQSGSKWVWEDCYLTLRYQFNISDLLNTVKRLNIFLTHLLEKQSGSKFLGSNVNEAVIHILPSLTTRWFSGMSKFLVGKSYPFAEMQSTYCTTNLATIL